ncbi:universal stress family protein [Thioflavicoccus mobilis 8321]|uniref:Universal stress family protein n=1 Tax=Thioflavicoccus mobilis 8321 TaxID=765912 RepID=L0GVV2_9GAMM|nr:universal stress protein [Thioflavicoccus mobilis]AGA90106.1 universal stress family protein [Thioflavicoccus mobilis 8321]
MYQRVLIAVDGTEISELALLEAIQFVRVLQGTLCIAHGVDAVTANAYSPADRDRLLAEHRKGGWAVLQKAADIAQQADLSCEQRLLEIDTGGRGRLPELILREAERWGPMWSLSAPMLAVESAICCSVALREGSFVSPRSLLSWCPLVQVPAGPAAIKVLRDCCWRSTGLTRRSLPCGPPLNWHAGLAQFSG